MADGLSEHPESLRLVGRGGSAKGADDAIIVRSSEWPSFEEIQALLARWKQLSAAREPAPSVFPQP
jgi:hypothetical protein